MEVSDLGSIEHFVDLDEENTSVWSPSPETYLDKHRPPTADNDDDDRLRPPIRPPRASPHPATRTRT